MRFTNTVKWFLTLILGAVFFSRLFLLSITWAETANTNVFKFPHLKLIHEGICIENHNVSVLSEFNSQNPPEQLILNFTSQDKIPITKDSLDLSIAPLADDMLALEIPQLGIDNVKMFDAMGNPTTIICYCYCCTVPCPHPYEYLMCDYYIRCPCPWN